MKVLALALSLTASSLTASPVLAQEMDHSAHQAAPEAVDETVGDTPAPTVPSDHAADRIFSADRMARSRAQMVDEMRFSTATVMVDQLEYRAGKGRDGYAWEAEAWYGGDIDRLAIATEGEGAFGRGPKQAEVRAVWRHALDPWFDLELGVRQDFRPDPKRSYAVVGIEGLAPYWFELEGQLFLSSKGDVHARIEASYDQRITQRLILQPRLELDAALQNVPELGIGAGLESFELGARLRYEFVPEFAPYVGVHWERKLNGTADFARSAGDPASSVTVLFGFRSWF